MLIVLGFTFLAAVNSIKSESNNGGYITNNNGYVIGIYLRDYDLSKEYNLTVESSNGETKEARIYLNNKSETEKEELEVESSAFSSEIDKIIREIKTNKLNKTMLPQELPDGSKINWQLNEETDYGGLFYIILPLLLVAILIKNEKQREAKINKEINTSILIELPRFTNQILLLLNSSLILSDCIVKIIEGYMDNKEEERTIFQKDLIKIDAKAKIVNKSVVYLLNEYASEKRIRELSRLVTVMIENIEKGSDIREKMERESNYLWDNRKAIARENGQFIETKMTVPLGLLLIMLVVVTMAPAILNM
ncbi:MAG: type II secretion system F family protein [Peptostreptococcaceae bacterium]|nr:type II secretion system F family protein [Peptostreptococcaceae bacterium]